MKRNQNSQRYYPSKNSKNNKTKAKRIPQSKSQGKNSAPAVVTKSTKQPVLAPHTAPLKVQTSNDHAFYSTLKRDNLYVCYDPPGDGNCFFTALGQRIGCNGHILRDVLVYAMTHEQYLLNLVNKHVKHCDINTWIENMSQRGYWADELVIAALATYLGVHIVVYSDASIEYQYNPKGKSSAVLAYINQNHYVLLDFDPAVKNGPQHLLDVYNKQVVRTSFKVSVKVMTSFCKTYRASRNLPINYSAPPPKPLPAFTLPPPGSAPQNAVPPAGVPVNNVAKGVCLIDRFFSKPGQFSQFIDSVCPVSGCVCNRTPIRSPWNANVATRTIMLPFIQHPCHQDNGVLYVRDDHRGLVLIQDQESLKIQHDYVYSYFTTAHAVARIDGQYFNCSAVSIGNSFLAVTPVSVVDKPDYAVVYPSKKYRVSYFSSTSDYIYNTASCGYAVVRWAGRDPRIMANPQQTKNAAAYLVGKPVTSSTIATTARTVSSEVTPEVVSTVVAHTVYQSAECTNRWYGLIRTTFAWNPVSWILRANKKVSDPLTTEPPFLIKCCLALGIMLACFFAYRKTRSWYPQVLTNLSGAILPLQEYIPAVNVSEPICRFAGGATEAVRLAGIAAQACASFAIRAIHSIRSTANSVSGFMMSESHIDRSVVPLLVPCSSFVGAGLAYVLGKMFDRKTVNPIWTEATHAEAPKLGYVALESKCNQFRPLQQMHKSASVDVDYSEFRCRPAPGNYRFGLGVALFEPVVSRVCTHNALVGTVNRACKNRLDPEKGIWRALRPWAGKVFIDPFNKYRLEKDGDFRVDVLSPTDKEKWLAHLSSSSRAAVKGFLNDRHRVTNKHASVKGFVKRENVLKFDDADYDPRIISGRTPSYQYVTGRITHAISKHVANVWSTEHVVTINGVKAHITYASGLNCEQVGNWFAEAIRAVSAPIVIEADASRWDSSLGKPHLKTEMWLYKRMRVSKNKLKYLKMQYTTKGRINGAIKYRVSATRKSGDGNTSVGNSLLNGVMTSYVVHKYFSEYFILIMGDDILVVGDLNHRFKKQQIQDECVHEFRRYGFTTVVHVTQDIWDVTFCSGRFYPIGPGEYRFAPKLGRLLCKIGYAKDRLHTIKDIKTHAKGVALGLNATVSFLPCLGVYMKRLIAYNVHAEPKLELYKIRADTHATATSETYDFLQHVYGLSKKDFDELDTIYKKAPIPSVIDDYRLAQMINIDCSDARGMVTYASIPAIIAEHWGLIDKWILRICALTAPFVEELIRARYPKITTFTLIAVETFFETSKYGIEALPVILLAKTIIHGSLALVNRYCGSGFAVAAHLAWNVFALCKIEGRF